MDRNINKKKEEQISLSNIRKSDSKEVSLKGCDIASGEEMETLRDEELAFLASEGVVEAVDMLLNRYKELGRMLASHYFIEGADREDVAQEAMIGLYRAIMTYDRNKGASFKSYSTKVIDNHLKNAVKNAVRLKHSILNDSLSFDFDCHFEDREEAGSGIHISVASNNTSEIPEKNLEFTELKNEIDQYAKNNLSEFEQKILVYLLEGFDYREISHRLKKEPKAVDNGIQRLKKKMKSIIED